MFHKQGTPQPIKIASGVCEICGQNPATALVDGRMICEECKAKMTQKE
ncbi:MAG: hypothetical protein PHF86_07770 [Candidatus Nanoarchaeia archaeon]|jgi:hypothetical protein|nr:hypothetical protein [Candidatus Nanoarchaeia archaeon]